MRYQGDKFKGRFDANCFVRITQSMDSHDVGAGRGDVAAALGSIAQPALVIGIKSDGLFMLQEQRELAELIPHARLVEIDSPDGHDGFLLEFGEMNKVIRRWLRETLPDLFAGHLHDGGGAEDGVVDDDEARASVAGEGWGDWDAHVAAVAAGAVTHVLT